MGLDYDALAEALDAEFQKRNINRTPDFPHGRSIKWPKVYRGLRRRGMSKEKAARISNAASNKYRGGRRLPLSATAGKKSIPEDILDKRPDLRKPGGRNPKGLKKADPAISDVHNDSVPQPTRRKRKGKNPRALLQPRFTEVEKHYGPQAHPGSGTPQTVHDPHSGGGGGTAVADRPGGGSEDPGNEPFDMTPATPAGNVPADMAEPETSYEKQIRPDTFDTYIGQTDLVNQLKINVDAAKKRGEPLGHTIINGPPGLGKTTLAGVLAKEMGSTMRVVTGPAVKNPKDLQSLLMSLEPNDILFIDEIHALPDNVAEILYPVMEDFQMDAKIGEQTIRLDVPKFTLVGATTRQGTLPQPLRDRFVNTAQLEYYDAPALAEIINRTSGILDVQMAPDATLNLAERSRGTPRLANNLTKWINDYALSKGVQTVDTATVDAALKMRGVDHKGLTITDRAYLKVLADQGSASGLNTIASMIGEDETTITDAYEPFLLREGYIARGPRGREITEKGLAHLQEVMDDFSKRTKRNRKGDVLEDPMRCLVINCLKHPEDHPAPKGQPPVEEETEEDPEPVEKSDEQAQSDEDNLYDWDGISHRSGGRWKHAVTKHLGPGPHPSGTPQSVHGRSRDVRGDIVTFKTPAVITRAVDGWFDRHPALKQFKDTDWKTLRQDHDFQMKVAKAYDDMDVVDPSAKPFYDAFSTEVEAQFDYLTTEVGIKFEAVDDDPYRNVLEAAADLEENGRLKVLATSVTGGHPMLSDEVNDKFRFIHDIFGHIATGRSFDRHGEEAAFLHHASMFTTAARPAMASETRGQNASLIANREFPEQKAAIMPAWTYELRIPVAKAGTVQGTIRVTKASDEYENLVFGWASISTRADGTQVLDKQGDMIDLEELESAAYNFVVKSYGTGDMHQSEPFGEMVESMVITPEKLSALGLPEDSLPRGWWVGFRVPPEYHEQVRTGKRSMFSIEGTAKRQPIVD